MKIEIKVLLFTGLCSLLTGCVDQPDAPVPDPCAGKNPVTAEFAINPMKFAFYPDEIDFTTDTVSRNWGKMGFKALQDSVEGTEYTWTVGNLTLKSRYIVVDFSYRGYDNHIPITLTVQSPAHKACFSNDTSYVTKAKYLTFIDALDSSKVAGVYKGYVNDNKADTATLIIDLHITKSDFFGTTLTGVWVWYSRYPQYWSYKGDYRIDYEYFLSSDGIDGGFLFPGTGNILYYESYITGKETFKGKRVSNK